MADLQELFARLKSPGSSVSPNVPSGGNSSSYHPPTVSSPIFSPSPSGPPPHHESAIISPQTSTMNTPAPEQSNADRTTSLLNLLKFNQPSQSTPPPQSSGSSDRRPSHNILPSMQVQGQGSHSRAISASDLVASFMNKPSSSVTHSPAVASPTPSKPEHGSSGENPQDLLLRLLNHPKPPQSDSPTVRSPSARSPSAAFETIASPKLPDTNMDDLAQDLADARLQKDEREQSASQQTKSPIRIFGAENAAETASFEPLQAANKGSIFTYVNPFEQLSASSPRNRTPKPEARSKTATPKVEILTHRKDNSAGMDKSGRSMSRGASDRPPKSRRLSSPFSPFVQALTSIPSGSIPHESVSEAVSGVGEQVAKEVAETLAQAGISANGDTQAKPVDKEGLREIECAVHDAAVEIKRELEDDGTKHALEEVVQKPVVDAIKDVADEVAQENVADSWESADAEDNHAKSDESIVRVYNFPMRPFTSIDITKLHEPPTPIRQDIVMEIARSKKEFDQIDRNLVTASKNFIVYALSKQGGMRLISQESGQYRQAFQNYKERIFNLSICTAIQSSAAADEETVLGTGVNGTVFWVPSLVPRADTFPDNELEEHSLIFPPAPAHDDNTSGGQLKTRAKTSCRHPEYFAIGRGKSIHIVWPKIARLPRYMNQKTRVVDSEKYLEERSLKIATGRAGKDFAFSEDDTVIATLDKAGKIRFWDIRALTVPSFETATGPVEPQEVKEPLLTYITTHPNEKAWPTSIFFVDKDKPCAKGIALRYLIVGMKQNHTLQLWDLGLGKAVQEINLPHEKESDAICSVAYHPKTGILAVGHPTRNSVYFIHVSAPRYNIPAMSQAKYMSALGGKDKTVQIQKPEATAIMSGIREFSFANKGQLRSLYMLNEPAGDPENDPADDPPLFELYAMHSKGITCLRICREDLGWTKDNRVEHPVDAAATGAIDVDILRAPPIDPSVNGDAPAQSVGGSQSARESVKKESASTSRTPSQTPEAAIRQSTLAKVESKQDAARAAIINGEKAEKKKKKKRSDAETASQVSTATRSTNPALAATSSYAQAAQRAPSPTPQPVQAAEGAVGKVDAPTGISSMNLEQLLKHVDERISIGNQEIKEALPSLLSERFATELGAMYRKFDEDRRVKDAADAARQDAVLRLVSSTLSENVEKSLTRIVMSTVQSAIVPALSDVLSASLDRRLAEVLENAISGTFPKEMKNLLQPAVNRAMQEPEVLRTVSGLVTSNVTAHLDQHLRTSLHPIISTAMENVALASAQQIAGTLERRFADQFIQMDHQRRNDTTKIDQLTGLMRGLLETVHTMAAAQTDFQGRILEIQQQINTERDSSSQRELQAPSSRSGLSTAGKSPQDEEQEQITQLMADGKYEEGTIMWLQSPRQAELFDSLFVRCNPAYIKELSPLVALSVSAAVSSQFENNVAQRLVWLDSVFATIDPRDPEIVEVCPKIMDVLCTRLQGSYMQIAENEPANPILRRLSALSRRANELKAMAIAASA